MKKLWLFVLALALPVAMVAQSPAANQGAVLTPKQIAAALRAVATAKVQAPAAGQLVAKTLPRGLAVPSSSLPVIAPGLFTVGTALAAIGDFQPTPCFACLTTTDSLDTFGIALPANVFASGDAPLQFVQTFQNLAYNGPVTLSLVLLNGNQVIAVSSLSGSIYPSTWYVYYLQPTPTITGTTLQAAAVITVGTINQVRSLPFYVVP